MEDQQDDGLHRVRESYKGAALQRRAGNARTMPSDWLITVAETLAKLPQAAEPPAAQPFVYALEHGTAKIGLYKPEGVDPQGPHQRDELYVVWRGSGRFQRGTEIRDFGAGDVIFVPAGMPHRFVDFGDDFVVWVIFYGPAGGEAPFPSGKTGVSSLS
jgi:mannose-6-phosphate isomerase-like protein (cupin superfamily)